MEHEDKSLGPVTAPEPVDRTRVVSAAAAGDGRPGSGAPRSAEPSGDRPEDDEGPAAAAGSAAGADDKPPRNRKPTNLGPGSHPNNVRRLRIERMMSKAELARRANVSVLTIDRVEKGFGCRMDTKRKILEALGLTLADRVRVFGDED